MDLSTAKLINFMSAYQRLNFEERKNLIAFTNDGHRFEATQLMFDMASSKYYLAKTEGQQIIIRNKLTNIISIGTKDRQLQI